MTTTKTSQPTTEQEPTMEQIMKDLDMARAMDETEAVARLSAELKAAINKIFTADGVPFPKTADEIAAAEEAADVEVLATAQIAAIAEDSAADAIHKATASARVTICIELAHREALAAEAIKNDINAKLAANGYTANGEALAEAL